MMQSFLISAVALLAIGLSARSEGGSKIYRDEKYGFSFSYPDDLSVEISTAPRGDLRRLVIMNGPCAAGELRLVRTDKAKVALPKRFASTTYDRKRNMWLETDPETGAIKPVCIAPTTLASGLTAYTHTDAMHGWRSDIVLTNKGTAFVWTNTPHSEGAVCELESQRLLGISRTMLLSGDLRSIKAKCPKIE